MGVIGELLSALEQPGSALEVVAAIDASHVKVHKDGANPAGGQAAQGIGRTRGGSNTKIHAVVGANGKVLQIIIGPGQQHDSQQAIELTKGMTLKLLLADKAYDSDELRAVFEEQCEAVCIPSRKGRKNKAAFSKPLYKVRHCVENFFERIKRYRRISTRYDKLMATYLGFVQLAALCSILGDSY